MYIHRLQIRLNIELRALQRESLRYRLNSGSFRDWLASATAVTLSPQPFPQVESSISRHRIELESTARLIYAAFLSISAMLSSN